MLSSCAKDELQNEVNPFLQKAVESMASDELENTAIASPTEGFTGARGDDEITDDSDDEGDITDDSDDEDDEGTFGDKESEDSILRSSAALAGPR